MSDPKKPDPKAPDQKPTPPVAAAPAAPAAPAASSVDELAKAKAELAELEAKQELSKVQERIDSLRNGGKSGAALARIREMEAKRAKTHAFEQDGKKYAKYQTKELRYHQGTLVKAGSIVDFPWEALPGDSLLPVTKKRPSDEQSFEPQNEG